MTKNSAAKSTDASNPMKSALPRRRAFRRRKLGVRVAAVIVAAVSIATLSACEVNQPASGLSAQDKIQPSQVPTRGPNKVNVAYGPGPAHKLDVYLPTVASKGTFVYFHSGGWVAGTKSEVVPFVRYVVNEGYSVVSVEYRLAPAVRYPQILADADRAIRFVKVNAAKLGVNTSTLVVSGSSAGGYLALMMGAAPGKFADPALPSVLKSVSPSVDAVVDQVGPSNLETLWQAGGWGPQISDALLGCAAGPYPSSYAPCAPNVAKYASPWFYASLAAWVGQPLPPLYAAYGGMDTLVQPATQGRPLLAAWEQAAGVTRAWYDNPPAGDHSLDFTLNRTLFKVWLNRVHDRNW